MHWTSYDVEIMGERIMLKRYQDKLHLKRIDLLGKIDKGLDIYNHYILPDKLNEGN